MEDKNPDDSNWKETFFLGLITAALLAVPLLISPHAKAEEKEQTVQVPMHVVEEIQAAIEDLKDQVLVANRKAAAYEQKYKEMEKCVREHAAEQRPVLSCFTVRQHSGIETPEEQEF